MFRRRLSFEQLESRKLMAVTTANFSGTLRIVGDAQSDDFAILGTGNPGEISVTGRNGTAIDGVVNGRTVIQGITDSLSVDLRDGDNVLSVGNVYLNGIIDIETWGGNDLVMFGEGGVVSSARYCDIDLGAGARDEFRATNSNVFIGELVNVRSSTAFSAALVGLSTRGPLIVSASYAATNNILLNRVTAGTIIVTSPAAVNNVALFNSSAAFGSIEVNCASGQNSIYIDSCYSPHRIQARSFTQVPREIGPFAPIPPPYNVDATITIARCLTPQIIVETGDTSLFAVYMGGNDRVFLYGNSIFATPNRSDPAHAIHLDAAGGNNEVNVSYNVATGDALIELGSGDDTLNLTANLIVGTAIAEGGPGTNRLTLLFNQFDASAITNFFEPSPPTLRPR
jgi:hypothetical protein